MGRRLVLAAGELKEGHRDVDDASDRPDLKAPLVVSVDAEAAQLFEDASRFFEVQRLGQPGDDARLFLLWNERDAELGELADDSLIDARVFFDGGHGHLRTSVVSRLLVAAEFFKSCEWRA